VSGTSSVGGLVGNSGGSTITSSYYDKDNSGATGNYGTGLSTKEMKNISSYAGWDFESVWEISPSVNGGYPHLQSLSQSYAHGRNPISASEVYLANQRQKNETTPTTIEFHTGNPITPQVDSVVFNTVKLAKGTDYEVSYENNTETGSTAKIIIQGKGNYYGTKILYFYITDTRNIAATTVTVSSIPAQLHTGSAITPKPVIKDFSGAVTLREGTTPLDPSADYWLSYQNNTNITEGTNTATVLITGIGPYAGTQRNATFSIVGKKSIAGTNTVAFTIDGPTSYTYTGNPITPEITSVTYNPETITLLKDTDYTISYANNINKGTTGTVTITGIGNYTGTASRYFTITTKPIDQATIAAIPAQPYTGTEIKPPVTVTDGERTLILGTDYEVSYSSNTEATEWAMVQITGKGNYSGIANTFFEIYEGEGTEKIDIPVRWSEPLEFVYNGTAQSPTATATYNDLPFVLSISGAQIDARSGAYEATASFANTAYNLVYRLTNSTIPFYIRLAPITANVIISDIKAGQTLSPSVSSNPGKGIVSYLYSATENGEYTSAIPSTQGTYFVKAVIPETSNYLGYTTAPVPFAITGANPTPIPVVWGSQTAFVFNGEVQGPSASATLGGGTFPITTSGEINTGNYTSTATLVTPNVDYMLTNATQSFTITAKPLDSTAIDYIVTYPFTGTQICPNDGVIVRDGAKVLAKDIDYTLSCGENISVLGVVTAIGKGNYYGETRRSFNIASEGAVIVKVTWSGDTLFTYNGTEQYPTASVTDNIVEIDILSKQTNAGNYTAIAQLKTPNPNVILANASRPYTILPKPLTVSWTPEREFTYNKMVQVPIPSVQEAGVVLRVVNGHSAAGLYEGALAPFAQIVSSNASNYELSGHIIDKYEIKQKPLQSRFSVKTPADDFAANADTIWVPRNIFSDSTLLHSTLAGIIDYEGFATDDKGDSDDASVLRGTPKVTLEYIRTSPLILSKRVETTQKATATIVTENMSADNYVLVKRDIVVMEAIAEADNAPQIFCKKNASCALMSENSCGIIGGEVVPTCTMFCMVEDVCAPMPISSCTAMGGIAVEACEVPILRPALSGGSFRVWQTASGVVNVDLGYMPSSPAKLQIYDLKGNLVATEQVNTRFANVRVGMPSGVYLFKVGNDRVLKAAVL